MKTLWALLLSAGALCAQADPGNFLTGLPDFRDIRGMLTRRLNQLGHEQLDKRRQAVERITTAQDLAARRKYVRERMLHAIGGFPERTPLNAKVTGVLDRDGYRIEKIVFESRPRFFVTANLYVPKSGPGPFPGVLFPLGHEPGGKSYPVWQQLLVTLARRGYVALAYEPPGQGERVQYYDKELKDSKLQRSTTEHSMLGGQSLLLGYSLAHYTIWDGVRALDYLLSRKEVDGSRIAVTGNSGGGTHTAYLAALEDRIHVAAPSCYLTSWGRLLETIGPQDAEQNLPPWLGDGLDHGDFVYAAGPKPYLILSAVRDFFSILGARGTYAEAQRVYAAVGAKEKIHMVEADDGHGYSKPRRMAAYRWFGRWLKGAEDLQPEVEIEPESEVTLRCTETGQVATSLGGETVFSLNLKRLETAKAARKGVAAPELRTLIGYHPQSGAPKVTPYGETERDGYRIRKLLYESEPGILVPSLLYLPAGSGPSPAVIYAHGRGKAAAQADAAELVKAGFAVLSVDMRGTGETATTAPGASSYSGYFGDYDSTLKALLLGKSLVGLRAVDISRGIDLLSARPEIDRARIYGLGREGGAVVMLHAAALDDRIRKVGLEQMLVSYEAVVRHPIHRGVYESIVRGALGHYDLPELARSLAPRTVWVVNPADPLGNRLKTEEARQAYPSAVERRDGEPLSAVYRELFAEARR